MTLIDYTLILPSELLHAIFTLLPGRQYTSKLLRKVPSWVAVSQTCRRWREISLKCRALWTRAPFPNFAWAEEALRRSSPTLLDVFIDAAFHSEALIDLALRDLSRIGALHLSLAAMSLSGNLPLVIANTKTENHVLPACARGPAPNLEELSIVVANDFDGLRRELLLLSKGIFGEVVPVHLRRLVLEGCVLPAGSSLLRAHLTSLTLSSTKAWSDFDEMRNSLTCMPRLETLILRVNTLANMDHPSLSSDTERQRVDLTRLHILDVWCACLDDTSLLLDNVRIPMDASIIVATGDSLGASEHSLKRIATSFHNLMDACQSSRITYFQSTISIPGSWFTYAGTQHTRDSTDLKHAENYVRVGRDVYHKRGLSLSVAQDVDEISTRYTRFKRLLGIPAIASCRILSVRDFEDHSPSTYWTDFFSNFTEVVELDLVRRASFSFVDSMAIATHFPALRLLWISEATITAREDDPPGLHRFQDDLRDGIFQRVASGKLKKIRIFRCDVSAEYIRELTDEIGTETIEWDGRERGWQDARLSDAESSLLEDELDSSSDESSEDLL
ncbi:hypothetical protein PENSPDRAFT_746586 [Peniophora sp. CONT]|nr:hypothetical protein PENSPDRAFT_746586 [Peniophora sp. CONT]